METVLILLLILAHALDGYTTYRGLNGGGAKEANPIARFLFRLTGTSLLGIGIYKAVIVAAFIGLASVAADPYQYLVYGVGIAVGLIAGFHNLSVLGE